MSVYVFSSQGVHYNIHHYDTFLLDKIFDSKINIYNFFSTPLKENSVILTELDWLMDLCDEQKESIRSIKNKKIVFINSHKSLQANAVNNAGKVRCDLMNAIVTNLEFNKNNVYVITQMKADREHLLPYFLEENITDSDKWLDELYHYQINSELKSETEPNTLPTKRFSFFNRRYSAERFAFVSELIAEDLLNNFVYTFTNNLGVDVREKIALDEVKKDIPVHLMPYKDKIEDWVDNLPYAVEDQIHDPYPKKLSDLFKASQLNIVYETHPIDDLSIITEKTYKAMFYDKPFLVLSQPGALKILKNSGYKTFSPFIDESYDDIDDYNQRATAIIVEIKRLNQLSDDQFQQLIEDCKPMVEHNQTYLMSEMRKRVPDNFKLSNMIKFSDELCLSSRKKKMRNLYFNDNWKHVLVRKPVHPRIDEGVYIIERDPIIDHSVFVTERFTISHIEKYLTKDHLKQFANLSDGHILFLEDFTIPMKDTVQGIVDLITRYRIRPKNLWFSLALSHQCSELKEELASIGIHGVNIYFHNALLTEIYNQYTNNIPFFEGLSDTVISKRFSAFTRRFDYSRYDLFCNFLNEDVLKDFNYTFTNFNPENRPYPDPWVTKDELKNHELTNLYLDKKYEIHRWIDGLPYCLDVHDLRQSFPLEIYKRYKESSLNIVIETSFTHYHNPEQQDIMLTEKTYKAIVSKKPFMMMAPSGSLELLQKEGFRTFESLVDESYDKTDVMAEKQTLIINQIKMLNKLTDAEFFRKISELDKTVNYNLRRFLNLGRRSELEHEQLYQDLDLVRK